MQRQPSTCDGSPGASGWVRKYGMPSLVLAMLYFLFGHASFLFHVENMVVTPVLFAPEGIALALVLRFGAALWPGVFAGQLALALSRGLSVAPSLSIAAINSIEAVLAVWLFRTLKLDTSLPRARDLAGLLLLIFLLLQPFSATLGNATLWWSANITSAPALAESWLNWWIGNSLGQMLFAPLLLALLAGGRTKAQTVWDFLTPALVLTPAWFAADYFFQWAGLASLVVLLFPIIIILAISRGMAAVCTGCILVALWALKTTSRGEGPFFDAGEANFLELNIFLVGLALSGQFLTAFLCQIRGQQKLREELRDVQEQLQRKAFESTENLPVGCYSVETLADGTPVFRFASSRWLAMCGFTREQFDADNSLAMQVIHPDDRQSMLEGNLTAAKSRQPFRWEGRIVVGGQIRWVVIQSNPRQTAEGRILWDGVMEDVTARKEIEKQLSESQATLAKIIENMPFPVAAHLPPPDWSFTQINSKFQETFGYAAGEFQKVTEFTDKVLPDPEYRREAYAWFEECYARAHSGEGRVGPRELTMTTRDGRKLDILFSATILNDLVVVAMQDITELNKTSAELSAAQDALAKTAFDLTENIPVGTYTMVQPPDGGMAKFSFLSTRFLELTGLDRDTAREDPFQAFACVHPDDHAEWVRKNVETFEKKLPFREECRLIVQGEIRWILAESTPRDLPDGTVVWEGALADITPLKQAEKMEAVRGEILQSLLADKPLGGIFTRIENFIAELLPGAQPVILATDKQSGVLYMVRNGGLPDAYARSLNGVPLAQDRHRSAVSGEACFSTNLRTDPHWQEHREAVDRAGLGACWAQPLRASGGGVAGVLAVYHSEPAVPSAHDRNQLELAATLVSLALEQKAAATERTARKKAEAANIAKAEFLAKMSHELRTPLHAIIGFARMLRRNPSLEPEMAEKIGTIVRSGEHLLAMVNEILEYGRIESGAVRLLEEEFCLHELLEELALIYGAKAAEKKLGFRLDCAPTVPRHALADGNKLRQILTNFLDNAVKFTAQGGVFLRARIRKSGQTPVPANAGAKTPVRLLLEIEDSGEGVPDQDRQALFNDFFVGSAGELQGGTGLGLSICRHLAEIMGGSLGCYNRREGGACFWVEVPILAVNMPPASHPPRSAEPVPGSVRVLSNESAPDPDPGLLHDKLGAALVDAMRNALAAGDMPAMRELAGRVREINPALATRLHTLANQYDYKSLARLLGNGDSEG